MSLVSIKIDDGNSNINTVHPACVEITVRKFHEVRNFWNISLQDK